MPKSLRDSPFQQDPVRLRTMQARVLSALIPSTPEMPVESWPVLCKAQLGIRAGYTAISGSITRALNGIPPGSSSGEPHLGLLDLGLVISIILDIDGLEEVNYRTTPAGVAAYQTHIAERGELAKRKSVTASTNQRYRKGQD